MLSSVVVLYASLDDACIDYFGIICILILGPCLMVNVIIVNKWLMERLKRFCEVD
jgi:hypothetical protein